MRVIISRYRNIILNDKIKYDDEILELQKTINILQNKKIRKKD